ncbi:hypothetical protein COO60DRAFT_1638606 [Scenedesmus sp. NREL 46B-D3]|nr:hypothetical protein COO60DRAFT_1638606 [Scenedesmus sp. NREL 46B-D3]
MAGDSQELHTAWQLLLQQLPELPQQQQSACTLLCVSKGMAACMHAAAAGQMQCQITSSSGSDDASPAEQAALAARLRSFACRLPKHGRMLQSLDLAVPGAALKAAGMSAALQQAAAAAAAAPGGTALPRNPPAGEGAASCSSSALQLQSFRGALFVPILQHLPRHSLTNLVITDDYRDQTEDWRKAAHVRCSLRHLTSLQRLVLIEQQGTITNLLVPALAGMQQLTHLDIGIHWGRQQDLHHLPASLLELNIGAVSNGFEEPDDEWERPRGALTLHLQLLSMGDTLPAAELQRLASCLTALQAVDLEYFTSREAAAAAAGWSCLPLQSLSVLAERDFDLPCMRHNAALTGLTGLTLRVWGLVTCTGSDLARVLPELKQLRALEVHGSGMHMPDDIPRAEHALQIAQAQLSSLQLTNTDVSDVGLQWLREMQLLQQLQEVGLP